MVSIESSAFSHCEITHITLSSGITNIGDAAFYLCDGLGDIVIPGRR